MGKLMGLGSAAKVGRLWLRVLLMSGLLCFAAITLGLVTEARAGTFSSTDSASQGYAGVTTLPNGKVLVSGGYSDPQEAELYDPSTGTFASTGSLNEERYEPTIVGMADGRVMVIGGWDSSYDFPLNTAEAYDSTTGSFGHLATLRPRGYADAIRLSNGSVLVLGGWNDSIELNTADLYRPAYGSFIQVENMHARRFATATALLPGGKVLVAGGYGWEPGDEESGALASAEVFDPATNTFTKVGSMAQRRGNAIAVALPDGKVLVAGGYNSDDGHLATAELYDPSSKTFGPASSMSVPRSRPNGATLQNGKVLFAGRKSEIYDPATGEFKPTGPTSADPGAFARLDDGRILTFVGSAGEAEVFDPDSVHIEFGASSPTDTNTQTDGTISWTAEVPATFECRYDSDDETDFEPCSSPVDVSWPAETAEHRFDVRALDGNGGTWEASHGWGYDARPIEVSWTSVPDNYFVRSATFGFSWQADRGGVTYQCSKNGAAWETCPNPNLSSSWNAPGGSLIGNSPNTFRARAIDGYGNVSNVLDHDFYFDSSAPGAVTNLSPANGASGAGSVTFSWDTPTDGSPVSTECSIDSTTEYEPCSSPYIVQLPAREAPYVLRVRTTDAAGHVQFAGSVPTRSFTIEPVPDHTLTVTKSGTGEGTVTDMAGFGTPTGINCGSTCEVPVPQGTTVALTVSASPGSSFVAWTGCDIVVGPICGIYSMDSAREVTAEFFSDIPPAPKVLTVTKTGSGTVLSLPAAIHCGAVCQKTLEGPAELIPIPAPGYGFAGWSGACDGQDRCYVEADQSRQVNAKFEPVKRLAVTVAGDGQGSVDSNPHGIRCGETCEGDFAGLVTLYANPAAGSSFAGWSGVCEDISGDTCQVMMNEARNVTATFAGLRSLAITKSGPGQGTVREVSIEDGIECGDVCEAERGGWVVLTATPDPGSLFTGWSGACEGESSVCWFYMTEDREVNAEFGVAPKHTVTVTRVGEGEGTVSSNPAGIECGETCEGEFGGELQLEAVPSPGSVFTGWTEGPCAGSTAAQCQVDVFESTDVEAEFSPKPPPGPTRTLTVTTSGDGDGKVAGFDSFLGPAVDIDCGESCVTDVEEGRAVVLTALPAPGSVFSGWTGPCETTFGVEYCVIANVDAATEVGAVFSLPEFYPITVTKSGTGQGTVKDTLIFGGTGAGIDCGDDCEGEAQQGSVVAVEAIPAPGSEFVGWSGCQVVMGVYCGVSSLAAALEINAEFGLQNTLSVTRTGNGQGRVFSHPGGIECGDTCASGMSGTVQLGAYAESGSTFTGWSGACSGIGACEVTMNQARSVSANFSAGGSGDPVAFYFGDGRINLGSVVQGRRPVKVNGSAEPVVLSGAVNEEGEFSAGPEGFSFPPQMITGIDITATHGVVVDVKLELRADGPIAGTVNRESGELHLDQLNLAPRISVYYTPAPANPTDGNAFAVCEAAALNVPFSTSTDLVSGTGEDQQTWFGSSFNPEGAVAAVWEDLPEFTRVVGGEPYASVACGAVNTLLGTEGGLWLSGQEGDPPPPVPDEHRLTVAKTGGGAGTVASIPGGIQCGASCTADFEQGTSVLLMADAGSGSRFVGWSGACSGSGSCFVEMSQARAVTAEFAERGVLPQGEPVEFTFDEGRVKMGSLLYGQEAVDAGQPGSLKGQVNESGEFGAYADDFTFRSRALSIPEEQSTVGLPIDVILEMDAIDDIYGTFDAETGELNAEVKVRITVRAFVTPAVPGNEAGICRIEPVSLPLSTSMDLAFEGEDGPVVREGAPFTPDGAVASIWHSLPSSTVEGGTMGVGACAVANNILGGQGGIWLSGFLNEPPTPFNIEFDHGLVTFGSLSNLNAVPEGEEISLSGEYTDEVGNFAVPVSGASFPVVPFEGGTVSGTVQFAPTGKITGKYTASTGRLALSSKIRARFDLDGGATCYLTRSMSFASNAAGNGWLGVAFPDGPEGEGAVLTHWNDVPAVTGGEACSDLNALLQGPGGFWLGRGIDSPPGKPINVSAPELSGTGIAGGQLKCLPGEWAGASGVIVQWTRDGDVFANVNENGKTKTTYNTSNDDIGDTIACQQVATNAAGSVTQASNSLTISPKPGPVNITPPTLTGTGYAGGQLKCAAGVWETGTYSNIQLQWTRNGEVFPHVGSDGKTKTTYNTSAGDINDEFTCQQVATKSGISTTAGSNPIRIVARP